MGLALAASRDNAAAARSVGVRTDRIRYLLWIVVAFATGMVGAVVYLQKARISPDAAFSVTDWTAYVIFIVVIGGVRTIEGPMIGVLLLWGLMYHLGQYGSLYLLLLGALAILVMLVMPRGLWGTVAHRWKSAAFSDATKAVAAWPREVREELVDRSVKDRHLFSISCRTLRISGRPWVARSS